MAKRVDETGRISPESNLTCDLTPLASRLEPLSFPLSKGDLLRAVGQETLVCSGGDQHTLEELLGPLTKEQFNSVADIQEALAHPVRLAHRGTG
jgi:hypothetical protein